MFPCRLAKENYFPHPGKCVGLQLGLGSMFSSWPWHLIEEKTREGRWTCYQHHALSLQNLRQPITFQSQDDPAIGKVSDFALQGLLLTNVVSRWVASRAPEPHIHALVIGSKGVGTGAICHPPHGSVQHTVHEERHISHTCTQRPCQLCKHAAVGSNHCASLLISVCYIVPDCCSGSLQTGIEAPLVTIHRAASAWH